MKWLFNLFRRQDNEIQIGPSDLHNRIVEIQARIAAFRSSYQWSEEPHKTRQTTKPPVVVNEIVQTKSLEMDALKAKLLGKKK